MFIHYLKTVFRIFKSTKLFSFINIVGLTIGMTSSLLLIHYVIYEKSYDRFHPDSELIYRLCYERTSEEGTQVKFASCCPPAADFIKGAYSEVEKISRIYRYRAVVQLKDKDLKFLEEDIYFVEPEIFEILNFRIIEGNPKNALHEPNHAFISKTTAQKYFGETRPIGSIISVDGITDYTIMGVHEDAPSNTHLKPGIFLSFSNVVSMFGPEIMQSWGHTGFFTYVRFRPDADTAAFEKKMEQLAHSKCSDLMNTYKVLIKLKLQPLTDIHLTSHYMQEYEENGSLDSVNFLMLVAFFIIIMAWVNYVNLSTARSLTRAKEVGIRKVLGASRLHLIFQFFLEIFLINLAAAVLAVVLINLMYPAFSSIAGIPLSYSIFRDIWFWIILIIMVSAGVLFSGLYPVAILSAFSPHRVLKGNLGNNPKGVNLRKVLVVIQFSLALVLMTGAFTISCQLTYLKDQDLGFDMEQMLVVNAPRVRDANFEMKFTAFKRELLRHDDIKKLCFVTEVPGRQIYWDAGGIFRVGDNSRKGKNYQIVGIDYDYIDVFGLKLMYGRNFSKEFPSDNKALILNESAVKWMGFNSNENAIGEMVDYWEEKYTIIGVLADFHQQSLKSAFEPHIYRLMPYGRREIGRFAINIDSREISSTIGLIKDYFEEFFPGNPYDYFFLDDYFNQQYQKDELFGQVIEIFAFLSVFVTGLGIFGISSYLALQRKKEVGIRKVMGASTGSILRLFFQDFLYLLFISLLFAFPIAFFGLQQWLNTFAFRMKFNVLLFLLPFILVVFVTFATIGSNIYRAARTDPVDSIKYE